MESKDNTDRNLARIHNATLEIFRKLIEEPNVELNMENHITNHDFLEFKKHSSSILHNNKHTAFKYYSSKVEQQELLEKASQVLGMNFDIKDLKNDDLQIRHKAKDNLVILEEYIKMIQNSIPKNNQKTCDKTGIFQNLAKNIDRIYMEQQENNHINEEEPQDWSDTDSNYLDKDTPTTPVVLEQEKENKNSQEKLRKTG